MMRLQKVQEPWLVFKELFNVVSSSILEQLEDGRGAFANVDFLKERFSARLSVESFDQRFDGGGIILREDAYAIANFKGECCGIDLQHEMVGFFRRARLVEKLSLTQSGAIRVRFGMNHRSHLLAQVHLRGLKKRERYAMRFVALGVFFLLAGCADSSNHANRGYVITQSHDTPEELPDLEFTPE